MTVMTEVPENVLVAFRFAGALWGHDPVANSEATAVAWSSTLAPYSVDELCAVLEGLAQRSEQELPPGERQGLLPPLGAVRDALREHRRKVELAATPLLRPPAAPHARITGPDTEYRASLRADAVRFHRRQDGTLDPAKLAEIDAWVDEVGPFEQAFLRKHGVEVEVTQPERAGGNVA